MNPNIFHRTRKFYPVLGAALVLSSVNPLFAQEDVDTLVWGFDNAPNWESTMTHGEDLIVNIELPAAVGKSAASAQSGSMLWKWRGLAKFADDTDVDPDHAWHEHIQGADNYVKPETDVSSMAQRPSSSKWIAVNLETGFEYEVEMSAE
jgi:hypothetical protein